MKRYVLVGLMIACSLQAGCRRNKMNVGGTGAGGDLGGGVGNVSEYPLDARTGGFDESKRVQGITLENVLFAYDSFQLANSEIPKVEAAADVMKQNAAYMLVVEGHCDERGSLEYNLSLGEHRALSVRAYLIGLGIDGQRIQTRSFGEERPLDPGHSEQSWSVNRRAEFAFYNP